MLLKWYRHLLKNARCTPFTNFAKQNLAVLPDKTYSKDYTFAKRESSLCKKLKEREKKIKMTARAQKEYMDYCMITQGYYDSGKEEGYKQGEKHGIAIGKEEAKLEAARNMLIEGDSTEKIERCTGLDIETIQHLAAELKVAALQ